MNDLTNIRISQLGNTITGKTPSSESPCDFGDKYMFVTPSDNFDCKTIFKTARYLSNDGVKKLKNKLLPPNSIMVTCIGSAMGKVAMNQSTCVTNQQINSIVPTESYSADYIYYLIRNNYNLFRNAAVGSTSLPLLNKTEFDLLEVPIHASKFTQQKIASTLSTLDSKIELNNKINVELEAVVKTIYDYWFVQFDFPISKEQAKAMGKPKLEGKAYKSSGGKMVWNEALKREIPEGWGHIFLDKISDIIGGSTPSKENDSYFSKDGIPWITPKDLSMNVGNKFIKRGELDVTIEGKSSASLNLLPKGTVLMSSRAPIGYLAIASNDVTTNQGFKSFVPKDYFSTEYIYYAVKNLLPVIEANASGSTFKEISGSVLKSIRILWPQKEFVDLFTLKVNPIFKRQELLEKENQELASLRDWLLPMLMNGQVKVKDRV